MNALAEERIKHWMQNGGLMHCHRLLRINVLSQGRMVCCLLNTLLSLPPPALRVPNEFAARFASYLAAYKGQVEGRCMLRARPARLAERI